MMGIPHATLNLDAQHSGVSEEIKGFIVAHCLCNKGLETTENRNLKVLYHRTYKSAYSGILYIMFSYHTGIRCIEKKKVNNFGKFTVQKYTGNVHFQK